MKSVRKIGLLPVTLAAIGGFAAILPAPAAAQSTPFVGQLMAVAFNFCPTGWAQANGQLLPINQYTVLFSLLGTTYGGNGQTTFALPDLRGREPIHAGQGPGLAPYVEGQTGGSETVTVSIANMPAHTHSVNATSEFADKPGPGSKLLAADANYYPKYSDTDSPPNVTMNPAMVGSTGGGKPITTRSPYIAVIWCISFNGVYPAQN